MKIKMFAQKKFTIDKTNKNEKFYTLKDIL